MMRGIMRSTVIAIFGLAGLGISGAQALGSSSGSVTHLPPPGGSTSACLRPVLAKLAKDHASLATVARAKARLHLMCAGLTVVENSATAPSTALTSSYATSGFRTFSFTACDGLGSSCFVNGVTADWSETFEVRFEHQGCNLACRERGGRGWVELDSSRYPGTWYSTWAASIPLWNVSDNLAGSGPIWPFARAWGNPDYVLTRDVTTVSVGVGPFNESWHFWLWMNLYPRGFVADGLHGSPG